MLLHGAQVLLGVFLGRRVKTEIKPNESMYYMSKGMAKWDRKYFVHEKYLCLFCNGWSHKTVQ